eukprot:11665777-Alexandrium_andersonii.AAC.1
MRRATGDALLKARTRTSQGPARWELQAALFLGSLHGKIPNDRSAIRPNARQCCDRLTLQSALTKARTRFRRSELEPRGPDKPSGLVLEATQ